MNRISLAYAGVHQIFQLSLAAHEIGEFESLICSLVDLPGKNGSLIARMMRYPSAKPLGLDLLPPEKVHEFPWPLLLHRLGRKLLPRRHSEHYHTNILFDRHVAAKLKTKSSRIFVCGETCSSRSMRAAKERGMICLMDCAGIPSPFLDAASRKAAAMLGMKAPETRNSPTMQRQKKLELELADIVLAVSELQKRALVSEGTPAEKIRVIPLWVDAGFWSQGSETRTHAADSASPLKVIFAGAVTLQKGVPFLLQAVNALEGKAELTLAGNTTAEMEPLLRDLPPWIRSVGRLNREQLRSMYASHDVMVMPSLGDSFGFVTLEAMAAGLPVIASENAGAPVPHESWRVPACDSAAITERLRHYLTDREALRRDSAIAREFATRFPPEQYRKSAASLFQQLLAA